MSGARLFAKSFLAERVLENELMDDPLLAPELHRPALRGLGRVNFFSGTAGRLAGLIRNQVPRDSSRPLRVLDIACGGADVTIGLAKNLQSSDVDVMVEGWDISQTAIDYARSAAATSGVDKVSFRQQDAFGLTPEAIGEIEKFDCVFCTLFLHHLDSDQSTNLLRTMTQLSCGVVIVDDLLRTKLGFVLAWAGCRILSRSPIVHVDGPMSVKAAFTESEFRELTSQTQISIDSFFKHWPERFTAMWSGGAS